MFQGSRKDFASAKDLWEKGEQVLSCQSHGVALTTCELGNFPLWGNFLTERGLYRARRRRRKRKQLEVAQAVSKCALRRRGGDNETRTRDLYVANVSRYQLCYIPMQFAALRRITRFHRHP